MCELLKLSIINVYEGGAGIKGGINLSASTLRGGAKFECRHFEGGAKFECKGLRKGLRFTLAIHCCSKMFVSKVGKKELLSEIGGGQCL